MPHASKSPKVSRLVAILLLVVTALLATTSASLHAQSPLASGPAPRLADGTTTDGIAELLGLDSPTATTFLGAAKQNPASAATTGPGIRIDFGDDEIGKLSSGVELFLFMTLLAFAPAIVLTMTCFPRIIIVLAFLRRAISIQELPPSMVVSGFAVFLTIFVMMPVIQDLHNDAYTPYVTEEIGFEEAMTRASTRMTDFMLRQTREEDIALVLELSESPRPATPADVPFHVVVPAFILSEIKTAFQMGFVLFLPFIVIDLVISSILISMGMFTLPPVVVSTPLKILLFIMVDGWNLVVASLYASFASV
jgi:flagellar biosynthetic protein FliP